MRVHRTGGSCLRASQARRTRRAADGEWVRSVDASDAEAVRASGREASRPPRTVLVVVAPRAWSGGQLRWPSGRGMRHSLRWGGRPLDALGMLTGPALSAYRVGRCRSRRRRAHGRVGARRRARRRRRQASRPGRKDDSRLELHTRSIAWPGLDPRPLLASLPGRLGEPLATRIEIHTRRRSRRPAPPWHLLFARSASAVVVLTVAAARSCAYAELGIDGQRGAPRRRSAPETKDDLGLRLRLCVGCPEPRQLVDSSRMSAHAVEIVGASVDEVRELLGVSGEFSVGTEVALSGNRNAAPHIDLEVERLR